MEPAACIAYRGDQQLVMLFTLIFNYEYNTLRFKLVKDFEKIKVLTSKRKAT